MERYYQNILIFQPILVIHTCKMNFSLTENVGMIYYTIVSTSRNEKKRKKTRKKQKNKTKKGVLCRAPLKILPNQSL